MVLPFQTITKSAAETQELGSQLGHSFLGKEGTQPPRIICLWGDLGSGKTTFVQGVARGLGITSRLLSPTFIIVRRYSIPKSVTYLYHLDLYRLKDAKDGESVGFTDLMNDPSALVVIEWPERLGALLPEKRLDIMFLTLPDGDHKIECKLT